MGTLHKITPPGTAGPFETERQAATLPAVRATYDAMHASPRHGVMGERNHRMLCEAITAAGVELGAFDHRIVQWLSQWEPQTCAVIAGIITRAAATWRDGYEAGADDEAASFTPGLDNGQREVLGQVLADALDWRQPSGQCTGCDDDPSALCGEHAADLDRCDAYIALGRELGIEISQ